MPSALKDFTPIELAEALIVSCKETGVSVELVLVDNPVDQKIRTQHFQSTDIGRHGKAVLHGLIQASDVLARELESKFRKGDIKESRSKRTEQL